MHFVMVETTTGEIYEAYQFETVFHTLGCVRNASVRAEVAITTVRWIPVAIPRCNFC